MIPRQQLEALHHPNIKHVTIQTFKIINLLNKSLVLVQNNNNGPNKLIVNERFKRLTVFGVEQ